MSEATAPNGFEPSISATRLLSDERLVRRAAEGDERAFAAMYRRYSQDLYRFCLAIVGNPHDAAEALQNTMLKVMRALPGERRQIQLKPWLYRIAHNESVEVLRRRPLNEPLEPELAGVAPSPADSAEQRARLRRLLADLAELPERQRGALVMRELSGLGFEEIGAALGTSAAVARQTLYEARLSLRQMEEGRELSCDDVTRALSDADGRVTRRRDIRAHLRGCHGCRAFRDELRRRRSDFAGLAPLPAAAAAGILQGILGGGGTGGAAAGAAGTGIGAAAAGKAAGISAIGGATVAKGAATVAVVAAVGVGAADRSGVVDIGLPGGGSKDAPARSAPAPGVAPGATDAGAGAGGKAAARSPGAAETNPRQGPDPHSRANPEGDRPAAGLSHPSAPGASAGPGAATHGSPPSAADHGQETAAGNGGGADDGAAAGGADGSQGANAGQGAPAGEPGNGMQGGSGKGPPASTPAPASPPTPQGPPGEPGAQKPAPPGGAAAGQAPAASSEPGPPSGKPVDPPAHP